MVIKSVGGVKIQGENIQLVKRINSLLKKMSRQKYFQELPFEKLDRIVIVRKEMDLLLSAYKEKDFGSGFPMTFKRGTQGLYSLGSRTIYLLEPGLLQVVPNHIWQWEVIFLHEFSHFLRHMSGGFPGQDMTQKNKLLEEIRVTNMATYLAKKVVTNKEKLSQMKVYSDYYNNYYRYLIRLDEMRKELEVERATTDRIISIKPTSPGGQATVTITGTAVWGF